MALLTQITFDTHIYPDIQYLVGYQGTYKATKNARHKVFIKVKSQHKHEKSYNTSQVEAIVYFFRGPHKFVY